MFGVSFTFPLAVDTITVYGKAGMFIQNGYNFLRF